MIEYRNLVPDPRCTTKRNTASGVAVTQYDTTDTDHPGKWRYERPADVTSGANWISVYNQSSKLAVGDVMYAHLVCADPDQFIHYQQTSPDGMTLVWYAVDGTDVQCAWSIDKTGQNHNITTAAGAIILLHAGAYSSTDWTHLLSLYEQGNVPLPWSAGPTDGQAGEHGPWEP